MIEQRPQYVVEELIGLWWAASLYEKAKLRQISLLEAGVLGRWWLLGASVSAALKTPIHGLQEATDRRRQLQSFMKFVPPLTKPLPKGDWEAKRVDNRVDGPGSVSFTVPKMYSDTDAPSRRSRWDQIVPAASTMVNRDLGIDPRTKAAMQQRLHKKDQAWTWMNDEKKALHANPNPDPNGAGHDHLSTMLAGQAHRRGRFPGQSNHCSCEP